MSQSNQSPAPVDVLAAEVADASVELQRAIANRTQAKKARKIELDRYADDRAEERGCPYPLVDHYGDEYPDEGCENAIATYKAAAAVVTATRWKRRRATTKYARVGGAQ